MEVITREIEPRDYFEAAEMIKATIIDSFGKIYPDILVKEFCKKYENESFTQKASDIEMFVAESGGKIVGIIGLKGNNLRTFYVHPLYQGKGIGRQLFNLLERIAVSRKISKLFLEGSPFGQPIYEHFGFIKTGTIKKERVGQIYTDAKMEKALNIRK